MLRRSALCLAGIALWPVPAGHAQKIVIIPGQVMTDEAADIRVTGLEPGAHITLRADLIDGDYQAWASEAEFVAGPQGMVDLQAQAPVGGGYRIVSPMGLIWSMRPTSKDVHIYKPPHDLASQMIHFHLLLNGAESSSAQLEQLAMRDDVRPVKVNGTLEGTLFLPAGDGKHPGVLVLGGSEGGMPVRRAAWLASHGYAAFALCYFRCEGRPPQLENIPLEYFGQALGWMAQRPEIASDRLAVMGVSRGGELALQLGSMFPDIKAVVAFVPSNVRNPSCCRQMPLPAWTWKGSPLAWAAPGSRGNAAAMMRASIAVEFTHGPVLMIGGEADGVWSSAEMVDSVAAHLRQAHFAYKVVVLKYPHAGHRAGLPEIIPAWHDAAPHPLSGLSTDYGGTPEGNAASTLDAIPRLLDFLAQNLQAAPAQPTAK